MGKKYKRRDLTGIKENFSFIHNFYLLILFLVGFSINYSLSKEILSASDSYITGKAMTSREMLANLAVAKTFVLSATNKPLTSVYYFDRMEII